MFFKWRCGSRILPERGPEAVSKKLERMQKVMPVMKRYLRYAHSGTVGLICSRQCASLLLERSASKDKRLLAIAPALSR